MFRIYCITVILFLIGCKDNPAQETAIISLVSRADSLQSVIDSLEQELSMVVAGKDSLAEKYKEQRTLILFTRSKCLRYSKIVGRDHSQAVFIVNWIHRAFEWVDE
jgi:hypothetical protein